ncbi:MAG: ADP-ribosylglycohydrolase family protein, partial [Anaerolineae bacterium]|nr:ADP-ribosylglycohydrolase family protein [Anaerolineae bacterium]
MSAITPDLLERARGSLLGAAVGDAFGMSLEGAPRQPVNGQVRALRRGRLPAGHFTAATGSALTVAEGLLAGQAREDLAQRVGGWQQARRAGSRPEGSFLRRLARGRPGPGRSEGAAPQPEVAEAQPLVRCLAIPLATVGDRNACLEQARSLTRLTHQHPECVAGAAFLACVLWHL